MHVQTYAFVAKLLQGSAVEKFIMIIREQENNLLLITQPHHAALSGTFAEHWKVTAFRGFDQLEEVLYTVRNHDRCWEEVDKTPRWNPETEQPYSFENYPEQPKIRFYTQGLDGMERDHPYPALLCSKHFASFYVSCGETEGREFYRLEQLRQERLIGRLGLRKQDLEEVAFHFHLLQFCDNLSLFICLNEEGKNQHPWFQKGFANSEKLGIDARPVKADWNDPDTVRILPFPFDEPFAVELEYRELPKRFPDQETLSRLWEEAPVQKKRIHFRGG